MIARVLRVRVKLALEPKRPLVFLAQANAVYAGLDGHPALFVTPNPALVTLFGQIQDATGAQQDVGRIKGAGPVRDGKFRIVSTSLESERVMIQGLCDASPEQALTLIAAAAMQAEDPRGGSDKPLLSAKNGMPSGTVLLEANGRMLDDSNRRKLFNWRCTLDGGESFLAMPSTPTGETSLGGLTPLTYAGFQVSVTVHKQPPGPWSQTVRVLVL
jgi:hypothetical protein